MKKIILCSLVAMMAVTAANAEIASVEYVGNTAELKTDAKDDFTVAINELVDSVAQKEEQVADANLDKFVPTLDRAQKMIDDSQSSLTGIIGDTENFQEGDSVMGFVNANTEAISKLNDTYVSETEMDTFKESNTQAIADAKQAGTDAATALATYKATNDVAVQSNTEAISKLNDTYVSETEMDTFKESNTQAITAAQTAADAAAEVAGKAQVKSTVLSIGDAEGKWLDLTKVTGYSATGTHSLVLKDGNIQWEAIKY